MSGQLIDHDQKAHEQHMCEVVTNRQMATAANLAKHPQYFCLVCGRVSAKAENVCVPAKL